MRYQEFGCCEIKILKFEIEKSHQGKTPYTPPYYSIISANQPRPYPYHVCNYKPGTSLVTWYGYKLSVAKNTSLSIISTISICRRRRRCRRCPRPLVRPCIRPRRCPRIRPRRRPPSHSPAPSLLCLPSRLSTSLSSSFHMAAASVEDGYNRPTLLDLNLVNEHENADVVLGSLPAEGNIKCWRTRKPIKDLDYWRSKEKEYTEYTAVDAILPKESALDRAELQRIYTPMPKCWTLSPPAASY